MSMRDDLTKNKKTTDHDEIREWVESRDGKPARLQGSGDHPPKGHAGGVLRVDFGMNDEQLERMSWDDFFDVFDANDIAFLYQDETADGGTSRFFKFVHHDDSGDETMLDEEDREIIEDVDAGFQNDGEGYSNEGEDRTVRGEDI